jgi:beta-lactamase regulating signal transducer with metallopeptidase domain
MSELFRTIEPWAEAWGSNLWRASWQGGLVIVAAWAITRWCKFLSPRFACWIWRLACIKLLVGLIWVQPVAIPILTAGSPRILTAGNERRELAPTQTEIAAIRVNPEVWPVTANGEPRVSPAAHGNWNWLLALWLVGVGFRVSLTVRQWKSAQRLCRSAELAKSTALQDVCRHVADRLGLRKLPLIQFSPHTNIPLLAGVWRPMILLPAGALEAFDDCELRLMLGHEMAHLKRRDLLWNWLPTVASWLFFFHPLIWFLPRRWSEALEAACDELLIRSDSAGAAACGRLLVKLAARWPEEQRAQLMAAGALGTYRDLERRILAMARVKPISHRRLLVAAATASLVAVLGIIPWRLVAQEPKADKTATPQVAIGEATDLGQGKTDAAPQPATNPASKAKSATDKAPEAAKSPPPSAGDEQGSETRRDIQKRSAPILAAMAKEHGYGLDKDQNLRRIPPPFAPRRKEWYGVRFPTEEKRYPAGPKAIFLRWANNQLSVRSHFPDAGDPQDYDYRLGGLFDSLMGIKHQMVDGPPELLNQRISGDWVVRTGASDEQILKELAAILHNELSLSVRIEFREVQRLVYVVDGNYEHKPVLGGRDKETWIRDGKTVTADAIEIFGNPPDLHPTKGFINGVGKFNEFLEYLGEWIDTPIISDVKAPPHDELVWSFYSRPFSTEELEDEDHYKKFGSFESKSDTRRKKEMDERDQYAKLVLANITAQTGLRFREEMRAVKTLFVSRTK